MTPDKSNGYDAIAEHFIRARNPRIGPANVRAWSKTLRPGCAILDLGCGHGVPTSQVLIEAGFDVYGIDASPRLLETFRRRFPAAHTECAAVEESDFFGRRFDAILAWGLIFLLPAELQPVVIAKAARALEPGGKFLFTSPAEVTSWTDSLSGRESVSLGTEAYRRIFDAEGLLLTGEQTDEGENHYYLLSRPLAQFT